MATITGVRVADLIKSGTEKRLTNTINYLLSTTNELVTSGLAVQGTETAALMAGGPRKGSLPFLAPLDSTQVNVSTDDITEDGDVGKMTADEFSVLRQDLNYGWGYADLTRMITQFDVRGGIGAGIAQYWNDVTKARAISALKGALAAGGADLTSGVNTADIGLAAIVKAAATADVYADRFDILIVSPVTKAKLQMADQNQFVPASKTDIGLDTYAGKYKVVVSNAFGDGVSVLARSGALAYAVGTVPYEIAEEVERLANKGKGGGAEILHSRRSMVAHPQGFNYGGTVAPAKADLEDASKWSLAVPAVQVPFRKIVHKAAY